MHIYAIHQHRMKCTYKYACAYMHLNYEVYLYYNAPAVFKYKSRLNFPAGFYSLNFPAGFYSQRVFNDWDKLPNDIVSADSVNSFRNRLNKIKF